MLRSRSTTTGVTPPEETAVAQDAPGRSRLRGLPTPRPPTWADLVASNLAPVWSAARRAGLSTDEAAEVSELTWLRLALDLDLLVSSGTDVTAWLLATVEREACVIRARTEFDTTRTVS